MTSLTKVATSIRHKDGIYSFCDFFEIPPEALEERDTTTHRVKKEYWKTLYKQSKFWQENIKLKDAIEVITYDLVRR